MKYFKARDFKGLMDQCYTEDCEVIMANTPLLTGRDGSQTKCFQIILSLFGLYQVVYVDYCLPVVDIYFAEILLKISDFTEVIYLLYL